MSYLSTTCIHEREAKKQFIAGYKTDFEVTIENVITSAGASKKAEMGISLQPGTDSSSNFVAILFGWDGKTVRLLKEIKMF